jgi:predicted secreted protein
MQKTPSATVSLLRTPEVVLHPGATVEVEVPSKGATGHVWTVKADPQKVRIVEHRREAATTTFGGGGIETFTLQPLVEGRSTVTFELGAPWRKGTAEEHEFALDVRE